MGGQTVWMDRQRGWRDRWMHRRVFRQTDGWADGSMDTQTDGRTDQGKLVEGEGSVQLTSSLKEFVL
jgi:hypothetical protein